MSNSFTESGDMIMLPGARLPVAVKQLDEWSAPVMGRFVLLEDMTITNSELVCIESPVTAVPTHACVIRSGGARFVGPCHLAEGLVIKKGNTMAFPPGAMIITLTPDE